MRRVALFTICGSVVLRLQIWACDFIIREYSDCHFRGLSPFRPPSDTRAPRPASPRCSVHTHDADTVEVEVPKGDPRQFNYNGVFGAKSSQDDVFTRVGKPAVDAALTGVNAAIFAYGQTGAGKTHTMIGTTDDRGLIPRALEYLFEAMPQNENDPTGSIEVKCSFLEIYNGTITDLLRKPRPIYPAFASPRTPRHRPRTPRPRTPRMRPRTPFGSGSRAGTPRPRRARARRGSSAVDSATSDKPLRLRECSKRGTYVENLTVRKVASADEAYALVEQGNGRRVTGSHTLNQKSSRSHAVFTLQISRRSRTSTVTSKFHLIDLAGSEVQKKAQTQGRGLTEGRSINKSLSALGNVIMALARRKSHVPYRDSPLTFLLQDALGGNSRTTIIANVSPSSTAVTETLSTLKFADRVKTIENKVSVRQVRTLEFYADQNARLRTTIARLNEELGRRGSIASAVSADSAGTASSAVSTASAPAVVATTTSGRSTPAGSDREQTLREIVLHLLAENRHQAAAINRVGSELQKASSAQAGAEGGFKARFYKAQAQLLALSKRCPQEVLRAVREGRLESHAPAVPNLAEVSSADPAVVVASYKELTAKLLLENKALCKAAKVVDQENDDAFSETFGFAPDGEKADSVASKSDRMSTFGLRRSKRLSQMKRNKKALLSTSEIFSPAVVGRINHEAAEEKKAIAERQQLQQRMKNVRKMLDRAQCVIETVSSEGEQLGELYDILGEMDAELPPDPSIRDANESARARRKRKSCEDLEVTSYPCSPAPVAADAFFAKRAKV